MKFTWIWGLAVAAAVCGCGPDRSELKLAERGQPSAYTIEIGKAPSACLRHSAEEFSRYVKAMTGVSLPIAETVERGAKVVLRAKAKTGADGFAFAASGRDFVIEGESERGVLYGVYDFLENQCGCEWLSAVHEIVPERAKVAVPFDFRLERKPKLSVREAGWTETCENPDFAAKLKLNGHAESTEARLWLVAHLRWDPHQDWRALADRFLKAYYGKAAPQFAEYYAEMEKLRQDESKTPMQMWGGFDTKVMPDEFFEKAAALIARAAEAVKGDARREYNVRRARNANDYTRILRSNLGAPYECSRHPEYAKTPRFAELQAAARRILRDRIDDKRKGRFGEDGDGNLRAERRLRHFAEMDPKTVAKCERVRIPGEFLSDGTTLFLNDVRTDDGAKYRIRVRANLKRKADAPKSGIAAVLCVSDLGGRDGVKSELRLDVSKVADGSAWYELPGEFALKPSYRFSFECGRHDRVKCAANPFLEKPVVECVEIAFADLALPGKRVTRGPLFEVREGRDFFGRDFFWHWTQFKVRDGGFDTTMVGKRAIIEHGPYHLSPPFAGPDRVTFDVDFAPKDGTAILRLKPHERGAKPVEYRAKWRTPQTVFDVGADYAKLYDFVALELQAAEPLKPKGFRVEKVCGEWFHREADAVTMEIDAASRLYTVDWHSKTVPQAVFANPSAEAVELRAKVRVSDFYGREFAIPADLKLAPGETKRVPIPRVRGMADAKGVWKVAATLTGRDGSTAVKESRFAILDEHPVTPKVPYGRFRAGIHLHTSRYITPDEELTIDAAVRMGSKIVRLDNYFSSYELWNAREKTFDFRRADAILKKLEDRGLAVDAIVEEGITLRDNHFTREFCNAIARRYQDRIDYYEVGNEWDLVEKKYLTPEQGVKVQKDAYTWLKEGSKKARVTTNGWAVEDSNGHANVTQKGFQETFMRDARGYYDIHAMHLHFAFKNYVDRLGRFFRLRENSGVTAPWILNETALPVQYRGEEEVAENVWTKIIYGWAKGAKDYVWYNMRASAYDPGGVYGVVSHDFHPRLTFAAFSGLAACLGNHDFEKILIEREGRFVSRFRRRDGRREIVVAGWDLGLMAPKAVSFKTDARRVVAADVMNNRTRVEVKGGIAKVALSSRPQAFVFDGATYAEPSKAQLEDVRKAPPRTILVSSRRPDYGWDMRLSRYDQVHEEYPADPATAHRTWKGEQDCSGILLFTLKDGKATVRISVKDEKDAPGDRVEVWRDGRDITSSLRFQRVRHGDNRTVYTADWPDLKPCRVNVRFVDDDGFGGVDGWIDYTPFDAKNPDLDLWPIVRFD